MAVSQEFVWDGVARGRELTPLVALAGIQGLFFNLLKGKGK